MSLGKLLFAPQGAVRTVAALSAIIPKTHLSAAKYATGKGHKKGGKEWVKMSLIKSKKHQTGDDLLNNVSWDLHPDASSHKLRWKTKVALNKQLESIKINTSTRKNGLGESEKKPSEDSRNLFDELNWKTKEEMDGLIKGVKYSRSKKEQAGPRTMDKSQYSEMMLRFQQSSSQRFDRNGTPPTEEIDMEKVKEYVELLQNSKERLGIFDTKDKTKVPTEERPEYKTAVDWWNQWEKENRQQRMERKSHYQEMLSWTTEGKFPSFPINNEVGMEEEQNVPFHKHVFLHELLEDGFPKHGPVRRFMEVIILGLSKNPYLTVKEKEEHVQWFREYFNEKMDTLKSLGAAEEDKMIEQVT